MRTAIAFAVLTISFAVLLSIVLVVLEPPPEPPDVPDLFIADEDPPLYVVEGIDKPCTIGDEWFNKATLARYICVRDEGWVRVY